MRFIDESAASRPSLPVLKALLAPAEATPGPDQDALDEYLRDHAPRLRGDAMARFGGRFEAQRRVLRPRRT